MQFRVGKKIVGNRQQANVVGKKMRVYFSVGKKYYTKEEASSEKFPLQATKY